MILLLPRQSSKMSKKLKEPSRRAPTHRNRLTSIRTVSIRSDKAETPFVFEKEKNTNKDSRRGKKKKKSWLPPPNPVVYFFILLDPVLFVPSEAITLMSLLRGSERTGGSPGWGWRAGRRPAERKTLVDGTSSLWAQPITKAGAGGGFDWGRSGHQRWTWDTKQDGVQQKPTHFSFIFFI